MGNQDTKKRNGNSFAGKNCAEPICVSCAAIIDGSQAKILLEEAANERKTEAMSMIESQKEKAQHIRNKMFKAM